MYRRIKPLPGCLLCAEDKPLVRSHVVPNFFRRWLASELGVQPRFQNPLTRVGRYYDDLSKHQLCCADCEALMSRDESTARTQMLVEWKRGDGGRSVYGPWLARFAAGMCAKAAGVLLSSPATSKQAGDAELPFNRICEESLPLRERGRLGEALDTWRLFVLGKAPNPGHHELHLLAVNTDLLPGLRGVFGHKYMRSAECSGILILLNGVVLVGWSEELVTSFVGRRESPSAAAWLALRTMTSLQ